MLDMKALPPGLTSDTMSSACPSEQSDPIVATTSSVLAGLLEMKETKPDEYWRKITKFNKDFCWQWGK